MDEDLKIVLTSELEADEKASAQRISAQLPNIAKLINSKSTIKVGVELDRTAAQSVTQQIDRDLLKASKHAVGVDISLNTGAIQKFQGELDKLGVNDQITKAISTEMEQMGVRIDQISGAWKNVGEEERQLLNLTIQGTDQLGRKVAIAKQYAYTLDEETAELKEQSSTVTRVTADLEKQRQTQERLAAQAQKDNASRIDYLNQQQILLDKLNAKYTDPNAAKPIVYEQDLEQVNAKYNEIKQTIEALGNTQGKVSTQTKVELEKQIASYEELAKKIQNAEYVATTLRTRTTKDVNAEQVEKLTEYENKLRSSGQLTETFQARIDELRQALSTAFDSSSLTDYLNQFDKLKSEVDSFDSQLSVVNAGFTKMAEYEKKITSIKKEMLTVSSDSAEYSGLQSQLDLLLDKQKEISVEVEKQVAKNPELIKYASQYNELLFVRKDSEAQIVTAEGKVADAAKAVNESMQSIPAVVQNIEARFNTLKNAPIELEQKVRSLAALMKAVANAEDDKSKVEAYQRLKEAINGCNKEITQLLGLQNSKIKDFVETEKLEKAKSDLATIGRQWSALKKDPGLNDQFQQLGRNLQYVERGEMSLREWTAQFNRFKSEVKAAGKNVQSFTDIIKNNVAKVTQWVSATTILFTALRRLKQAANTVVELDTAMIDLQKVTVATKEEYNAFYYNANDTAKALGVTTEEVISQTAEWARLGYTMKEAAELAKNSAIFEAISPGMDISKATDGLVSIIKAYGFESEDALDGIISKINEIGNKFAVSNEDIVDVMTRTSSAMAAANNTFEETVALATAAIEITRDADSVGNGLKTLSMRIRGYDEETEEYTNDIEELKGAIADLTKVASNNYRGISLFEVGDPDTYRSTYDILSDIADIWDELTDKNRANLLETLFGKRQAQIGSAILTNFDQAREAIVAMENSAGSAMQEMEKIYDSLDYKLNQFKETWVGVAQNLINTDQFKFVVDLFTGLSEGVDWATDKLGLFGTVAIAVFGVQLFKSVSRPKETGFIITVLTYVPMVTWNELAA